MSETIYRAHFQIMDRNCTADSRHGPSAFREGFWIDRKLNYTMGMDAWLWVPPHAVKYVIAIRDIADTGVDSD